MIMTKVAAVLSAADLLIDNMRKKQFHYQLSRYVPNV